MPDIMKFIVCHETVEKDPNGYLLHLDDWSEEVAQSIAAEEDIELDDRHWEILTFLRDHYREFGTSPKYAC